MVKLKVRHDTHPDCAADEAMECLKRANIEVDTQRRDGETLDVSAVNAKWLDEAVKELNRNGFEVLLGGRASYSSE